MVIIDFKQKVAIYPEIGVSPDGMFPVSHFLPFDFKRKFVHRGACTCVRASMRAWLGLKAGNEREGVTHLILLPSFENLGVFRCFYSNEKYKPHVSH